MPRYDYHVAHFSGGGPSTQTDAGASLETDLWISLDIALPEELGVGDARKRFPQLVNSAQHGHTYLVRNMNRPDGEAVVIVSLNQLHRIAASVSEPVSGADILARLPFAQVADAGIPALRPAPLRNPGLPRHLGSVLRSDIGGDAAAASR